MKSIYSIAAGVLFSASPLCAQTNFQDLNFETAIIPPGAQPGANVTFTGWTPSTVVYDGASLGGQLVSIEDSKATFINFSPLQGKYSVILFAGPDGGFADSIAIEQTGLVPITAESILMDIAYPFGAVPGGVFTVSLGAEQIPMEPLQVLPDFTVYGGDVSAFAGNLETLTIRQFPPDPPNVPPSAVAVDNIIFSPAEIPEPGTWALMLCGAGVLFVLRHKRKG